MGLWLTYNRLQAWLAEIHRFTCLEFLRLSLEGAQEQDIGTLHPPRQATVQAIHHAASNDWIVGVPWD